MAGLPSRQSRTMQLFRLGRRRRWRRLAAPSPCFRDLVGVGCPAQPPRWQPCRRLEDRPGQPCAAFPDRVPRRYRDYRPRPARYPRHSGYPVPAQRRPWSHDWPACRWRRQACCRSAASLASHRPALRPRPFGRPLTIGQAPRRSRHRTGCRGGVSIAAPGRHQDARQRLIHPACHSGISPSSLSISDSLARASVIRASAWSAVASMVRAATIRLGSHACA